ncbi:U4/U6.U5 tri-snRNP-associated protein 2 isoform X1 [Canna indica]|uniref:U4/U6.U5 tri-snRNP-associated protein 2 isoform X1 n=1 Tax=Canna indica TaxID=4628 RepID=A0AAQ3L405_9LILI|nr:U4/U6.U5 tri-snRNP-associated protein 2 isoform X1 [Canna indica]
MPMEAPAKRSREEEDDEKAEAIKRQRLADGEEDEDGGGESALPGLAVYKDDDEEEDAAAADRREQWEFRDNSEGEVGNGRGEETENGVGELVGGEGDEEAEEEMYQKAAAPVRHQRHVERRRDCPYLDTVNRQVLDFDFERFCSISLSNLNVYACLVCGKYYQGRGLSSHAYTHSLEAGHHVYINLQTEKVYCLPDGYEIDDPSLDDIRHVLNPRFSRDQVRHLDENRQWSRALDGSNYLPGMVGLNNIKETDFVNVTIQSLMRVTPLRNFFLIPENYQHSKSPLVHRFGELTRKIWHARNFKGQVSPHEFLQAVMKVSNKRFQIGVQSDPVEFMSWLLNTLHTQLRPSKKKDRSIIYDCFQGELEVVKEIQKKFLLEKQDNDDEQNKVTISEGRSANNNVLKETSKVPFLMLGLDLPPPPLFKDAMEKNIIPQVPLFNILKKFDGETITEVVRPCIARMRYRVTRLPKYMILHMRRFTKNNFFVEKNPTLVNFPVKNLELKDYIPLPPPKNNKKLRSKYDLIANIVHDGKPGEGYYRVFVQRKSEELWYEMQDLHVTETLPQMVALSEAYMQIYEQQE